MWKHKQMLLWSGFAWGMMFFCLLTKSSTYVILLLSLDQKYERKQFRKVCELSKEIKVAGLILSISFLTKALITNRIYSKMFQSPPSLPYVFWIFLETGLNHWNFCRE